MVSFDRLQEYKGAMNVNDVNDMYEAECTEHEINMLLDQIKEEFFDNRIRMYKLTKFGLIKLLPCIKTEKTLEFLQTIKRESTVLNKV